MPTVRRKRPVEQEAQATENNDAEDGGILSGIVEEATDLGIDSVLSGLVDIAASAGGAVADVAGSLAESAIGIAADVAGSALEGL